MTRLMTLMLSLAGLLTPLIVSAHDYSHGELWIDHPWTRPTPPGVMMGAGYMSISNNSDYDIVLTAVSSPRAGQVSIHRSRMDDGVMKMEALTEGLVIPAGTQIDLKPHSYHLMLEQLKGPLQEGERIPLVLTFEGAPEMAVELAVDSLDGETMPMQGHDMGSEHMGSEHMSPQGMDHSGMHGHDQ